MIHALLKRIVTALLFSLFANMLFVLPSQAARDVDFAVSLRVLESRLRSCMPNNCDIELELGGMTQISGFVINSAESDIVLLGRAIAGDPTLKTEEYVLALRNAIARRNGNTSHFPSVSIDIEQKMADDLDTVMRQGGRYSKIKQRWRSACVNGQQKVRVYGMDPNNRFIHVMVDTDYNLKRFVNGDIQASFPSLHRRYLDSRSWLQESSGSMDRFELVADQNRSWAIDLQAQTYILDSLDVVLITENQARVRGIKGRVYQGSGKVNRYAEQFAQDFTRKYDQIASRYADYSRLAGLFDLVAVTDAIEQHSLRRRTGVDLGYLVKNFPVQTQKLSPVLQGLSSEYSSDTGDKAYFSCGGVNMYMPWQTFHKRERNPRYDPIRIFDKLRRRMATRIDFL